MNTELQNILANLPAAFFGTVEIGYQNGQPGVVKITQTHKIPSRGNRENFNGNTR